MEKGPRYGWFWFIWFYVYIFDKMCIYKSWQLNLIFNCYIGNSSEIHSLLIFKSFNWEFFLLGERLRKPARFSEHVARLNLIRQISELPTRYIYKVLIQDFFISGYLIDTFWQRINFANYNVAHMLSVGKNMLHVWEPLYSFWICIEH